MYVKDKQIQCNIWRKEYCGPQNDCNIFGRLYIASQCRGEDIDDFSPTKLFPGHYEYQKYFVILLTNISIMLYITF